MVSVIIVNHNTKELTADCIRSVMRSTKTEYEIIVVDNSPEKRGIFRATHPKIRVVRCRNRGFGHACNIGLRYAKGEYILLLNSDTIVHKGAIDTLSDYLDKNPDAGAVGGKTILSDGKLDHSCKRGLPTPLSSLFYITGISRVFPSSPFFSGYHKTYLYEEEINDVQVLSGAFMMIRRGIMTSINGFDERFFMYGEDVDLCYRTGLEGWRLTYIPDAVVTHFKGQSGLRSGNPKVILHFYRSMWLFYTKNLSEHYNIIVDILVYIAISVMYSLASLRALTGGEKR